MHPLLISTLATLLLLLVFTFGIAPFWLDRHPEPLPPGRAAPTTSPSSPLSVGTARLHGSGRPSWSVVAIAGLTVLGVALAALAARNRTSPTVQPVEPDIGEEIDLARRPTSMLSTPIPTIVGS